MKLLESALAKIAALTEERDALKGRAGFAEERLTLADAENANLRAQLALMATASQVRTAGETMQTSTLSGNRSVTVFAATKPTDDMTVTPTDSAAPAA